MPAIYQGASPNSSFLAGQVPGGQNDTARFSSALGFSFLSHVSGFVIFMLAALYLPSVAVTTPAARTNLPEGIVWLTTPGPGGGGGGGGNKAPEPPRKAEAPGKDKLTVPTVKPKEVEIPKPKPVAEVQPPLTIPAQTMQTGIEKAPGTLSNLPTLPTSSQGSGTGGGAGTGSGTGSGSGQGSGYGPGWGGGFGGGAYRPGNDVTSPQLVKEVKPNYTADAMRAKIQGSVTLEAIVLPDGSVGPVRVTRSLDPTFGLDQEAERTVKLWRFAPGTRLGQPVPVLVEIEMTFTLR